MHYTLQEFLKAISAGLATALWLTGLRPADRETELPRCDAPHVEKESMIEPDHRILQF